MKLGKLGYVLGGILIFVFVVVGTYEIAYWKKTYPGVKMAGISVGNKDEGQIKDALFRLQSPPEIVLVWGTSRWMLLGKDIEYRFDIEGSAKHALSAGRSGNVWENLELKIKAWKNDINLLPVWTWNGDKLKESIASVSAEIDIPTKEPEISIENDQVKVTAGENGQIVNVLQLVDEIQKVVETNSGYEVEIPILTQSPKLSDVQVEALRSKAQKVVGKKLVLKIGEQSFGVGDEVMVNWISKPKTIADWVDELSKGIDRPAENAHFRYVGGGRVEEFSPSVEGLRVKRPDLVVEIGRKLEEFSTSDSVELGVDIMAEKTDPVIKTDQANNLGIKELIGKGESLFPGSITNRIFNLKKAAGVVNGVLVAPGEIFSFNASVGDISAATGYKAAYIIKDGRTVLGDGGGVCQVSSTLFRAVLNAGLPIEERVAHAYRVHYYEEGSQPGFDATVFAPSVDFKFKNDTAAYILIQTKIDEANSKLDFYLYGTKDGRVVTVSKARVWDVAAPPPALYQDDPTLPRGVVKQVDWSAWGAKVAFDWKVTRGEEVLQERTFYSNFRPWQAVYLRGTL